MKSWLLIEYPVLPEGRSSSGLVPQLHFPEALGGDRVPDVFPDNWRQNSVDMLEYLRRFGFTNDREIKSLIEYRMCNLTGLYMRAYHPSWPEGYRWEGGYALEHANWMHMLPIRQGMQDQFLVVMDWGDEYAEYEGMGDSYTSLYFYQRDKSKPSYVPDTEISESDKARKESEEAYNWHRQGVPACEILEKYGLPHSANWQELANAAGIPIVLARWNTEKHDGHNQFFPYTDGVLMPQ